MVGLRVEWIQGWIRVGKQRMNRVVCMGYVVGRLGRWIGIGWKVRIQWWMLEGWVGIGWRMRNRRRGMVVNRKRI